jgi:hypothetical protein
MPRRAKLGRQYALPVVAMGELEPIKKHALPTYTGEWAFSFAAIRCPNQGLDSKRGNGARQCIAPALESEKAAAEPMRLGFGSMGHAIIPPVP